MPLITCGDCGSSVSDRAPSCPKCGAPAATRADVAAVHVPLTTTQTIVHPVRRVVYFLIAAVLFLSLGIWMSLGKEVANDVIQSRNTEAQVASLNKDISDLNKTLPRMVDTGVRLDKAEVGPGLLLTYHTTDMDFPVEMQIDAVGYSAAVSKKVCTGMRKYLKTGLTVLYDVHNKNGSKLVQVVVPLNTCNP